MARGRLTLLAAVCIRVCASTARAEPAASVEQQFSGDLAEARQTCYRLPAEVPSRRGARMPSTALPTAEVRACLRVVETELMTPDPVRLAAIRRIQPALSADDARRRARLEMYYGLRSVVAAWAAFIDEQTGSSLARAAASVDARARAVLHADGLLTAKYAAVLQGAFIAADPGGYSGQPRDTPSDGTRSAMARVAVDTTHVAIGSGWDASLGFQFGRQPLLRMTKPAAAVVRPSYSDGLMTAQTIRVGRASRAVETSIAGRAGATRIDVAGAAANDVAEWAMFFDASADLRWFAHLAMQTLDPLVHAYVGVRHDQRFHRAGDLSAFDDPTGRLFFGFAVNPVRVADPTAGGSGNTMLTIGGGFEYEGALRGPNRLPSGFKLFGGANLDLMRALRSVR
jgi:hypothetical protein